MATLFGSYTSLLERCVIKIDFIAVWKVEWEIRSDWLDEIQRL